MKQALEAIELNGLTQEEVAKVRQFIISLKKIRPKTGTKRFQFNWAGGLKDSFLGKSSVDLQHASANLR